MYTIAYKTILTISLLLLGLSTKGQYDKISYVLTRENIEESENGSVACFALSLNRKTINDTVLLFFPTSGTISDVYLYADSVFLKNLDTAKFLRHDKKYATQGVLEIDMTGLADGKYKAHILACGVGGNVEINIKTTNSPCLPSIDTIDGTPVYAYAEKMPYFEGGDQKLLEFIAQNTKYPAFKTSEDLTFRLTATFVIDSKGRVRNPCIVNPKSVNSISPLENEFLRALETLPNWKPGLKNGKNVAVRYTLPVNISWR